MIITRIFRVRIDRTLRQEFEAAFASVSVHAVSSAQGSISSSILMPTRWTPDEYAMISLWENEASLVAFAGEQWDRPVIPSGMEKFVLDCSVHHYTSWTNT